MLNCLLFDNQPLVRAGLSQLLKRISADLTICEAATAPAFAELLDRQQFSLIITELEVSNNTDARFVKLVRKKQPHAGILIFSRFDAKVFALPLIEAGANGFISKQAPLVQLRHAIRTVLKKRSI